MSRMPVEHPVCVAPRVNFPFTEEKLKKVPRRNWLRSGHLSLGKKKKSREKWISLGAVNLLRCSDANLKRETGRGGNETF